MNLSLALAIPSEPVWWWVGGLIIILLAVLLLPFIVKWCEHNLELFFLIMGILAVSVSRQWSGSLIIEALKAPVTIGSLPVGIFQVVLVFGLLVHVFYKQFRKAVLSLELSLSRGLFIFIVVVVLGFLSSVISVILTSFLLAEIVAALPLEHKQRVRLVIVACFALGLGAVLTPLGEPMSTILVQRLSGAPYNAGFLFPIRHFAVYVAPGIVAFALFGAIWMGRRKMVNRPGTVESDEAAQKREYAEPLAFGYSETVSTIILRALKVFAFVAALVLLGEGFKPLVVWFFMKLPAAALFWINITSAVLDNATLTAIEINSNLAISQIIAIGMALLIAGGMLIPGNIPNIISASRLKISMKEWAVIGIPLGLAAMIVYFLILLPIILK
jgi:predicted cation transporter